MNYCKDCGTPCEYYKCWDCRHEEMIQEAMEEAYDE